MRTIENYAVRECPFCGKSTTVVFSNIKTEEMCRNCNEEKCDCYEDEECSFGYFVVCSALKGGCGAAGGWGVDKETAVRNWNRRC